MKTKIIAGLLLVSLCGCGISSRLDKEKLIERFDLPFVEKDKTEWKSGLQSFDLRGKTNITFKTRGIEYRTKENDNGDLEYVLVLIKGKGFKRFMLYHNAEKNRMGRHRLQDELGTEKEDKLFPVANGVLEKPCEWSISLIDQVWTIRQRGKVLKREKVKTDQGMKHEWRTAIMGGYPGRAIKGEWADVIIK